MSLELYSDILTVGCVLGVTLALASISLFFVEPRVRVWLVSISYKTYLTFIGVLALTATVGALIYQYAYHLPVCELCWWQRIFMFPIEFIACTGILTRSRTHHVAISALAIAGLPFALYHYSLHFREMVLNLTVSAPCSAIGLSPSCSASHVLSFGFMTIPGMAALVFVTILVLCLFASRVK